MGVCCSGREKFIISHKSAVNHLSESKPKSIKPSNDPDKFSLEQIQKEECQENALEGKTTINKKFDNDKRENLNTNKLLIETLKQLEEEENNKLNSKNIAFNNSSVFMKNNNTSFIKKGIVAVDNPKNLVSNEKLINKTATLIKKDTDFNIGPKISKNIQSVQKNYYVLNKLGNGSFGTVFKVVNKKTGQIRAMKVIKKESVQYQDDDKKFLKEIEILRSLDHMNIIKIFEYFEDELNYFLITEHISGGELLDFVIKMPSFNENNIKQIMNQIMYAVSYLHKNSITHRDLKPENILIDDTSKMDYLSLKIIDFGTSNFFTKNKNLKLKVGSPYYIAPEVLEGSYSEKCDIWSCGCILYVLIIGYPPFTADTTKELFSKIKKGKYKIEGEDWDLVSENAKDLIKKMLNRDYKERISAQECLDHPFLKYLNEINDLEKQKMNEYLNALSNLKSFNRQDKLQQATIAYIVHFLTPANEFDQLKQVFKSIDKNGDGSLSREELKNGFEKIFGPSTGEFDMDELIQELDSNGDGSISYEEFLRVVMNKAKILNDKNLKLCFEAFDENKDNKLSYNEIKSALGAKDNDYVKQLIDLIDENKNQEIDFEEFKKLMEILLMKENK